MARGKESTALATQVKTLAKGNKGASFLEDLRDLADSNGKAFEDFGFGDVLKQLESDGEIFAAAELGNGFAVLSTKDKARLVGVPLLILNWNFNDGENGEFVSAQVMTNTERLIVNDGSTGIYKQLKALADTGEVRAIFAKHGLRKSEYEYTDPKTQEKKPAVTYYIDTTA